MRCEAEELGQRIQSSLASKGVVAFRIVDRTGLVLSSKDPARCGQRLRSGAFRQRLDLALEGTPQFVRPYAETELSVRGASGEARPVAWFLAPILKGKELPVAALAWASNRPRARGNFLGRDRANCGGVRILRRRRDADVDTVH